jgi:Domain of unknown function (DUF4333)
MKRVVCLAAAVAIAGCGETTIDSGKLEREISDDAEREGLVLDEVDCPSPEVEEGDTFACTVTVKGEQRKLDVVQREKEAVGYDLGPLLDFTSGSDAGGDEAAVRFVIDTVNGNVTALCDYATDAYRRELGGASCAEAVIARFSRPMDSYAVSVEGDTATAKGSGYRVTLRRQRDGSWLIADVAG